MVARALSGAMKMRQRMCGGAKSLLTRELCKRPAHNCAHGVHLAQSCGSRGGAKGREDFTHVHCALRYLARESREDSACCKASIQTPLVRTDRAVP